MRQYEHTTHGIPGPTLENLEPRLLLATGPLITEFLAVNDTSITDEEGRHRDWIEVHNPTVAPIDLTGWYLTDDATDLRQWELPALTLGPGEYEVIFASGQDRTEPMLHTNFSLKSGGEYLALIKSDGVTVAWEYSTEYPPQVADISYGLSTDYAREGYFSQLTPGGPNVGEPFADPTRNVVITEIMYHPSSENDLEEYFELVNQGAEAVNLDGWQVTAGVSFVFGDVTIPAGGYLVVAADAAAFSAKYPGATDVVAGWTGHLSNSGEEIEIVDPVGTRIDRVAYADEGDWGYRQQGPLDHGHYGWIWSAEHDGGGKSAELINLLMPNEHGQNWMASDTLEGTPGSPNPAAASDIPPMVLDVGHYPLIPQSADPVTVTARVLDELTTGLTVTLHHRVDGAGSFTALTMLDDGLSGDGAAGDGVYGAVLGAQSHGTVVEFYVEAEDEGALTRTWPAPVQPTDQQLANLLYQVDDAYDPEAEWIPGSQPIYRIIMTEAERAELADIGAGGGDQNSNAQMNATFINLDGSGMSARYLTGVRNRGHGSRDDPPNNYRVNFVTDRPWKGVARININSKYVHSQVLGSAIHRMAGNMAADAAPVQIRVNGADLAESAGRMFGSYAAIEATDTDFANAHFPDDPAGNVYKCFRSDTTSAEADLAYEGTDPNEYRDTYFKDTNDELDDWSDLIHMTDVLNNAPAETYLADVSQVIDVDQWMRYLAMDMLFLNWETGLVRGYGDDFAMYSGVLDPRFKLVPHDLDTLMWEGNSQGSINHSIFNFRDVAGLDRLLSDPDVIPLYYSALVDLIDEVFNVGVLRPLMDQVLGGFVPDSVLDDMEQFVADRSAAVLAQVPQAFTIQSSLPVAGGFPYTTTAATSLSGTANAAETRAVLVNGQPTEWSAEAGTWSLVGGGGGTAMSFQDGVSPAGYAGTVDTELHEGDPTADRSAEVSIKVDGESSGYERQALLRFDDIFGGGAGQVSATDQIVSATLTLRVTNEGNDISLHRMVMPWSVTDNWNAFGGNGVQANDAEAATQTDAVIDGGGTGFVSVDVTSALQAWQADPSGNHGWALLPGGTDGVDFDSSEGATLSRRPELVVTLAGGGGSGGGVALLPGINRVSVETFVDADATGEPLESGYIDVWYDPQIIPQNRQLDMVVRDSYLPGSPVLVRVEVLDEHGAIDRGLWDATVTLSADNPGVALSTSQVTLYNGLGTALVTPTGSGDFTLTATVGSLSVDRDLLSLEGAAMTDVSGTLAGTETTWSGIIHVTGDLLVPDGHTLTIDPGTLVLIDGVASGTNGTDIDVAGAIQSLGSAAAPVTVTAYNPAQPWGEIDHANAEESLYQYTHITRAGNAPGSGHTGSGPAVRTSNSDITFDHSAITDIAGKIMTATSGSDLTFRNSVLSRAVMGPEIDGTALLFEENWITEMFGANDNDGIYVHGQQSGQAVTMRRGVIADGDDDGLDMLGSTVTVEDYIIRDWFDKGISVFGGQADLSGMLLVDNRVGVSAKETGTATTTVNIDHATIVGHHEKGGDPGIGIESKDKDAPDPNVHNYYNVTNSILWDNDDQVRTDYPGHLDDIQIKYSNVGEAATEWVATNAINDDPLFVAAGSHDYHLQSGSPSIDAGDPASPQDPDATRADQGYFRPGETDQTDPRIISGGSITQNTTLAAAGGPYRIAGVVVVDAGVTLTILPGTTVFFEADASLTIRGQVLAEGAEYQQIRFTRVPGGANWDVLHLLDTMEDNRITHAVVEYGVSSLGMIALDNSNLLLDHVTFDNTTLRRIETVDSSLIVRNSTFTDTVADGVTPTDNNSEHIWGRDVAVGGQFIIENNTFGRTPGHNDGIDFDAGSRPADPVPQILNNVFMGGGDDALDLEGDAHIEGNVFLHYHKDQYNTDPGESNVISAGGGHEYVVVRNVFHDADHVTLIKEDSFMVFENNTVSDIASSALAFNLADLSQTGGPGRGAYVDGCIFVNTPVVFDQLDTEGSVTDLTVHRSILPAADHGYGTGNIDEAPRLADDFSLLPGSPALGSGPNALDRGAIVPAGASIDGEPSAFTGQTAATLTVGGPGLTHYKYRLNDGPWSAETPLATTIELIGLADGEYTVEVMGKNSAYAWQAEATASESWTVDTSSTRVRINEVLAENDTAVDHEGTTPDLIELVNDSAAAVNLADMSVSDSPGDPRKFVFGAETWLAAGEHLVLYADSETATSGIHVGFGLNAEGDDLYLYDTVANGGGLVDSVVFGLQIADTSIGRLGHDGAWGLTQPTFGAANVAQRTGDPATLKINEWLPAERIRFADDFVELYNPDALPVPLGGLFLTDDPATQPDLHEIPPLSFVAGGGWASFVADGEIGDANHVIFRLSSEQELIGLYDADLAEIDKIIYYSQTTDVSQGRSPDGSGDYALFQLATPGVDNPAAGGVTTVDVIEFPDAWLYYQDGEPVGDWTDPDFVDGGWSSGAATLGVESSELEYDINTGLTIGEMTYYFRKHFDFDLPGAGAEVSFTMDLLLDDGAVFYLNGEPVKRVGMGGGTVTHSTPAGRMVTDAVVEYDITFPGEALRQGDNVLAVEVHQIDSGSSDVVFALTLDAVITAPGEDADAMAVLEDLWISELMYHPAESIESEFVELRNVGATTLDLTGVRFTAGIDFTFGPMVLAPGGYVAIVSDYEAFEDQYGPGFNIAGEYDGQLSDGGEDIVLKLSAPQQAAVLRFEYDDVWYIDTDGGGFALEAPDAATAASPEWDDADSWQVGTVLGGTPATADGDPVIDVRINEALTHTDPPFVDAIELYNPTGAAIDIGGWYLSDSGRDPVKYRIPDLTSIPAYGYMVFDESQFNSSLGVDPSDFALDGAHGDDVWLTQVNGDGKVTRFVDHVEFGAAVNGESFGRWPNGSGPLYPMEDLSLWTDNIGPRVWDIVISEIGFNLGADADLMEFVEIHNTTASPIDLTDWRIRKGVDYDFEPHAELAGLGTMVIVPFSPDDADDVAAFEVFYGLTEPIVMVGPFTQSLRDGGEKVRLQRPDGPPLGEPNFIPRLLEDEVGYDDEAPWPSVVGESLTRVDFDVWGNDPANWTSGAATPGSVGGVRGIAVLDSSGADDDAMIQFTTALSQFRPGAEDSLLVRPKYPDAKQYVDVVNVGMLPLTVQQVVIGAPDVALKDPWTADIVLEVGETHRFELIYEPSAPGVGEAATQYFDLLDGLIIVSNADHTPSLPVALRGASTYQSDISYDGKVNLAELGVLNVNFGRKLGDAGFDPTADINGDDVVNLGDLGSLNVELGLELDVVDTRSLYDGGAGSLPGDQGWVYQTLPVSGAGATQSATADGVLLNTTAVTSDVAGYFSRDPVGGVVTHPDMRDLDRTAGYAVRFSLQVNKESHLSNDRAGFSAIVLSEDGMGIELGFWETEIWAQSGADFVHAEGAAYDTTAAVTEYELRVEGGGYALWAGGTEVLTGALRDYSAHANPVYSQTSFLFFGDDTNSADVEVELTAVDVIVPVPLP